MRLLLVVSILLAAQSAAQAGPPDPSQSTVGPVIVGSPSADLQYAFLVKVRDINGAPVTNVDVTIAFGNAGAVPYTAQVMPALVNCNSREVTKPVDQDGNALFRLRSGGFANSNDVDVRAGGVLLRKIRSRSLDVTATGEASVGALNRLRENLFDHPTALETDFDLDGVTGLGDLELFRIELFQRAFGTPCN